jgi:shikimate kinase
MTSNLVLAGFMGVGKTTVGRIVADRLAMKFVDMDEEIERTAGKRIADIFSEEGERAFRVMEAEVCLRLAAGQAQVIATGGGALLNEKARSALSEGSLLVCLDSDLEALIHRLDSSSDRPLFTQDKPALEELFVLRQDVYAAIPLHVDTTDCTPDEAAQQVIELWNRHS